MDTLGHKTDKALPSLPQLTFCLGEANHRASAYKKVTYGKKRKVRGVTGAEWRVSCSFQWGSPLGKTGKTTKEGARKEGGFLSVPKSKTHFSAHL